jgi:hypothetical protein
MPELESDRIRDAGDRHRHICGVRMRPDTATGRMTTAAYLGIKEKFEFTMQRPSKIPRSTRFHWTMEDHLLWAWLSSPVEHLRVFRGHFFEACKVFIAEDWTPSQQSQTTADAYMAACSHRRLVGKQSSTRRRLVGKQ